ncbi:MAG: hypothetical protein ACYST3_06335 [Planctomycetota bacterium]|jgi:hypothetical protein
MENIVNAVRPQKNNLQLTSRSNSCNKWLVISFWIIGIAMGAWQAWEARHHMSADGMSYIDVADAYMRGDWKMAVNGFWGPLYSWLIALAMLLLKPSPYYEFPVVHLVSFLNYLFTIGCFHFFIAALVNFYRSRNCKLSQNSWIIFPEWAWIALGYCLFLETSLNLIGVWEESPDMLVAAFVYLASGMVLRMRNGKTTYATYAFLGVILGFGYLSKAVMFPMAFVFLLISALSMGNFRKALPRTVLALIIFLAVSSPFMTALSFTKGRITFGDAGTYSYWFHVNGYSNYHWDGNPPGSGTPEHPPRKILDMPAIYEFGTPLGGAYPLWYDPTYWNEGLEIHFDLKEQLQAIKRNLKTYYPMVYPKYSILIFGSLILYTMSLRRRQVIADISEHYNLLLPAIAGFAMYCIVATNIRYVGSFFTLMWLGIFSGIRLPESDESKRLLRNVAAVMVLMMLIVMTRHYIRLGPSTSDVQWKIADALYQTGIVPGDRVASIGNSHAHFWARLARVRIVAEMPHSSADDFWNADNLITSKVFETFRQTGAKAVVTNLVPDNISPPGWRQLAGTDHFVYMLHN